MSYVSAVLRNPYTQRGLQYAGAALGSYASRRFSEGVASWRRRRTTRQQQRRYLGPAAYRRSMAGGGTSSPAGVVALRGYRKMVRGSTKDSEHVRIGVGNLYSPATGQLVQLLTSNSATNSQANSATGILSCPNDDSATINFIDIAISLAPGAPHNDASSYRVLVVWMDDLSANATATGTLPLPSGLFQEPVGNTWMNDFLLSPDQQRVRHTVLFEQIGLISATQTIADTSHAMIPNEVDIRRRIQVNKKVTFSSSQGGTAVMAGHYDSDVDQGQLRKGYLMLYVLGQNSQGTGYGITANVTYRVNYSCV